MSYMYYIAANKELTLGERGRKAPKIGMDIESLKKTKSCIPIEEAIAEGILQPDEVEIYDSMEDVAGIFIENITFRNQDVRKHFKNKFIYEVSPSWGKFFLNKKLQDYSVESYNANRKCLKELLSLIRENIDENRYIEIYTCWAGEEGKERNKKLDKAININTFIIPVDFEFKEGEYILVKPWTSSNEEA